MKRITCLLLVLIFSISVVGCSSETATKKPEEELRTEVKAEMEKDEKLREELMEELKNQEGKDNTDKDNQGKQNDNYEEPKMILKGKVIFDPGIGFGVAVDKDLDIDGHSTNEIYLKGINIKDYLDRNYFTYAVYENGILKDGYNGAIDAEVIVDKNTFTYFDEVDEGAADVLQIISLDGEKYPSYKADQDFPIDYYVDTFWWHLDNISTKGHMFTKDIKEFDFYKEIDDFRIAVDKILESGLYINMAEGDYYIEDEPKNYSDGEIQDINSEPKAETNAIPPGTFEEITPSEPKVEKANDYTRDILQFI